MPGTNIQINFESLAILGGVAACLYLVKLLIKEEKLRQRSRDNSIEAKTI